MCNNYYYYLYIVILGINILRSSSFLSSSSSMSSKLSSMSSKLSSTLSMKWLESKVDIQIPASKEHSYKLFSQLDQHPTWSPWLNSVRYMDSTQTVWTLKSLGLTFNWKANNTIVDPPNTIQWESLDGLPNKGRVDFIEEKQGNTHMVLSIQYDLPQAAVTVIESLGDTYKTFVSDTLLGDLKRFRTRLLKEIREERMSKLKSSLK